MVFGIGYGIAFIGIYLAHELSKGKSEKRKHIVWGIALMLAISPFLSFALGLTYAVIVGDGWAALLMIFLFPIGFIIGFIMLLVGIFKKQEIEQDM